MSDINIKKYIRKERFEIVREILISILVSTMISAGITFYFNKSLDKRVSSRQLIYDFSRTFFDNPKYRNISIAIEEQFLGSKKPILKSNGGLTSDYELDDYLGFLYGLYSYGKDRLVPYSVIEDQFSYYVCITYHNGEIQDYNGGLADQGFSKPLANGYLDDFAKKLKIENIEDCKE
jgi:hypothetical protein